MEYRITWEIELDADSPEEAAELALECQLDETAWVKVFQVCAVQEPDQIFNIDLNYGC